MNQTTAAIIGGKYLPLHIGHPICLALGSGLHPAWAGSVVIPFIPSGPQSLGDTLGESLEQFPPGSSSGVIFRFLVATP